MKIKLFPIRREDSLQLERIGDALVVNGELYDFSQLAEGETLPADAIGSDFFCGPVERVNGELHLSLLLPHGPKQRQYVDEEIRELVTETLTQAQCFPEPIEVLEDGPIALPGPAITREPLPESAPEPVSEEGGEEVMPE